jgi:hypothetical protein
MVVALSCMLCASSLFGLIPCFHKYPTLNRKETSAGQEAVAMTTQRALCEYQTHLRPSVLSEFQFISRDLNKCDRLFDLSKLESTSLPIGMIDVRHIEASW